MLVQQERIEYFYKELSLVIEFFDAHQKKLTKSNSTLNQQITSVPLTKVDHPDYSFFMERPNNLTVDFWLKTIAKRMAQDNIHNIMYSPFVAYDTYSANKIWARLAFDLAAIIKYYDKTSEITWLTIMYPKLKLIDPISFKKSFDEMPYVVHLKKSLPRPSNKYNWLSSILIAKDRRDEYILSQNIAHGFEQCMQPLGEDLNGSQRIKLGSVDNPSPTPQRPAACPRAPEILLHEQSNYIEIERTGSSGQAAGRRDLSCHQPLDIRTLSSKEIDLDWKKLNIYKLNNVLSDFQAIEEFKTNSYIQSYVFLTTTCELYFINASFTPELVRISHEKKLQFAHGLYNMLGYSGDAPPRSSYVEGILPVTEQELSFRVAPSKLNQLITKCYGYPRLDLRNYFLNEDSTMIYPLNSIFHDRNQISMEYHDIHKKSGFEKKSMSIRAVDDSFLKASSHAQQVFWTAPESLHYSMQRDLKLFRYRASGQSINPDAKVVERHLNRQQPLVIHESITLDGALGFVDKSSFEDLRPAACPRDPEILLHAHTYRTEIERTGASGQAAGRWDMKCQQPIAGSKYIVKKKSVSVAPDLIAGEIDISGRSAFTYQKFDPSCSSYKQTVPLGVYSSYQSTQLRPLSLQELANVWFTDSKLYFTDENKHYKFPRHYMKGVILPKWERPNNAFAQYMLPSLLQVIEFYYSELANKSSPIKFRTLLNDWSKQSILDVNFDNIHDLYALYAQEVSIDDNDKPNTLLSYFMFCFVKNLEDLKDDMDEIVIWLTQTAPHLTSKSKFISTIYNKHNIADKSDTIVLMHYFTKILPTAISPESKGLINSLNLHLKEYNRTRPHTESEKASLILMIINLSKQIFILYDEEVRDTQFDHTREQTKDRMAWSYLAKFLTGLGYFQDYLELLCPTLKVFTDHITKKPISFFNLRHCIFSENRDYLIVLNHSQNHHKKTKNFFNCNVPTPKEFISKELAQIRFADIRFQRYINQPVIRFQTWLAIEKWVNNIVNSAQPLTTKYRLIVKPVVDDASRADVSDWSGSNFFYKSMEYAYQNMNALFSSKHIPDVSEVVIKLEIVNNELIYTVEDPAKKDNIHSFVSLDKFMYPFKSPLNQNEIDRRSIEIINRIADQGHISPRYLEDQRLKSRMLYSSFLKFYDELDCKERYLLDHRYVTLYGKRKCFKDIVYEANFCMETIFPWCLAFIINISPETHLSYDLEKKYKSLLSELRARSYEVGFLNAEIEVEKAEKLFVSLMTFSFVDQTQAVLISTHACNFFDSINILPNSQKSIFNLFISIIKKCDYTELGNMYVKVFNTIIKPGFKNANLTVGQKSWLDSIVDGSLFNKILLHDHKWFIDVILPINERKINWSPSHEGVAAQEAFSNFHEILHSSSNHKTDNKTEMLRLNIEFIRFMKKTDRYEFLEVIRLVKSSERNKMIYSYLKCMDINVDETNIASICLEFFKRKEAPIRTLNFCFFKPIGQSMAADLDAPPSDLDEALDNLLTSTHDFVNLADNHSLSPLTW